MCVCTYQADNKLCTWYITRCSRSFTSGPSPGNWCWFCCCKQKKFRLMWNTYYLLQLYDWLKTTGQLITLILFTCFSTWCWCWTCLCTRRFARFATRSAVFIWWSTCIAAVQRPLLLTITRFLVAVILITKMTHGIKDHKLMSRIKTSILSKIYSLS